MSATESKSGTIGGDKLQQPTPPTPSLLMNKLLSTRKFAHLNQRKSACEERQRQQKEKKDTVYLLNHQERKGILNTINYWQSNIVYFQRKNSPLVTITNLQK